MEESKKFKNGDSVYHKECGEGTVIEILGELIKVKFKKTPSLMYNAGVNPALVHSKSLIDLGKIQKYAEDTLRRHPGTGGPGGPQSIGDIGEEDHDIDWSYIQVSSKKAQSWGKVQSWKFVVGPSGTIICDDMFHNRRKK